MSNVTVPDAQSGEVYVALPDAEQAFPATIEDRRRNRFALPWFRSPVAAALAAWLTEQHESDPAAWPATASFDGTALILRDQQRTERIAPHNGRYAIGHGWSWELSMPFGDPADDAAILADTDRLTPQDDEILVTIPVNGDDPAFPALPSAKYGWSRAGCPRFRPRVAEAVVAWIRTIARDIPDGSAKAYWDGDQVVFFHYTFIGDDGYLPERISPDSDGRYSIGSYFEWERAD